MERSGAYAAAFLVALVAAGALYDAVAQWAVAERDATDPEVAAARRVYTFLGGVSGDDAPRILVLGASDAREGIDGLLVDRDLAARGHAHETFNLAVGADTPLRRLPELPLIVEAKPALVVYFVGLHMFRDHGSDGLVNRFVPIADLAPAPAAGSEAAMLLGPAHLKALDPDWADRVSAPRLSLERAAIRDALADALGTAVGVGDADEARAREIALKVSSLKDPWTRGDVTGSPAVLDDAVAGFPRGWESLDRGSNANLRALDLILATLEGNGIPVLLVESPLNPDFERRLPSAQLARARAEIDDVARERGVAFVAAPTVVEPDDFADHVHANRAGRLKVSAHVSNVLARWIEGTL